MTITAGVFLYGMIQHIAQISCTCLLILFFYAGDVVYNSDETKIADYKAMLIILFVILIFIITSGIINFHCLSQTIPDFYYQEFQQIHKLNRLHIILIHTVINFTNLACESVLQMNSENRKAFHDTREKAIAQGYSPCHNCKP